MKQPNLKLQIQPYLQSRKTSCLAAGALMILHHFEPEKYPPNSIVEIEEVHKSIIFPNHKLGNFAELANYFLSQNLHVKFFLDGPHDRPSEIDVKLWKELLGYFTDSLKRAKAKENFTIVNRDFLVDELIGEVLLRRPVICETKFEDFVTHALVIRGVKDNTVYLLDPLKGYRTLLKTQLRNEIDLGYMKNALSVWKNE